MSRTIFNELGESRVINPRSGFSQFVDLSNNQTISGIKRFLSNLITNSNVNFNTTANVGRIIFYPNEPAGSGSQIVAIYTEDENDGQGWFFDSVGNLYYLGGGLSPVKIMLSGSTGDLTILSNFNGFGNIICHNILTSDIISSYSGGNITINNNLALGSNTINSGNITSTGTISCVDISSTGIIYANNVNLTSTGYLNVNNITSSSTTGLYETKIALSNEFIDINDSSLDIVATYIGFASPIQTLSTASKYMYIKPLSTGDFEIKINNIPNVVLETDWAQLATATQMTSSWYSTANVLMGFINPNPPAGVSPTMRIMGTSNQYIYYNTSNNFGNYNSTTSVTNWEISSTGDITCKGLNATAGIIQTTGTISCYGLNSNSGNINTSGSVLTNTINPNSGTTISSTSIWNFKNASAITNISLDAMTTSGNRLQIYGIASVTRYLYYNTSNNIGVFNTSTGTSVWSIDGTTGNIVTIGSYTVSSLSATSLLCNSITPLSGTTFTFGITSNCNWLKSAGVNRILMFPSSTSGDIMQICRTGSNAYGDGYWYYNNTGNFGYITGGILVWELLNTGGLSLRSTLQMINGAIILSDTYSASSLTDGSTYRNYIKMNTLFTSSTIGSIELSSKYISFVNPYQTLSVNSKYMFILPDSGGNFTQYINNVAGRVLQTDWANTILRSDYKFECYGNWNYIEGSQTGNVCGHWSNRTDPLGKPVLNVSNNWVTMGGMENNNASVIGSGFPNAGSNRRVFTWLIENTNNSGKALGLACNRTNSPYSVINTLSQASGFSMMGYYLPNRAGGAYSFTGEHSSMVCDEEYNDIMNYNTDDFLGMVVCSSGKIYNLPYDCDGNTYEKQVDNIKSVDCQPMTRLSKKYKDKAVLGVISHIERVGKNRNDLGATSWTGCMALDNDERRRIRVASIGEGAIWITNEYGNIENGDYITTSNIAGYSTKQDDDLLHNYTIAKATMDCVFDIEKPDEYKTKYLGDGLYASYIGCTYHSG